MKIQRTAQKAGIEVPNSQMILAGMIGLLVGGAIGVMVTSQLSFWWVGLIAGGLLPVLWVRYRIQGRKKAFDRQFEHCLRRMSGGLRAGQSAQQALEYVAIHAQSPARDVFGHIVQQIRTGYSVTRAMDETSKTVESRDLELAAAAISLHMQTGVDLALIFDQIADGIRDRQSFQARVDAATSEGRLTANVLAIMPFVAVWVMNKMSPAYMWPLFHTTSGTIVFIFCSVMVVAGWFLIRHLVSLEDI
ncbi:MAG: type II secretion system F family protein [Candidatus Saccharibacteria bacterium]